MAGLTREQRAARSAEAEAEVPQPDPVDDGLVEMTKGDEASRVHPSTVKSHKAAGWKTKD